MFMCCVNCLKDCFFFACYFEIAFINGHFFFDSMRLTLGSYISMQPTAILQAKSKLKSFCLRDWQYTEEKIKEKSVQNNMHRDRILVLFFFLLQKKIQRNRIYCQRAEWRKYRKYLTLVQYFVKCIHRSIEIGNEPLRNLQQ